MRAVPRGVLHLVILPTQRLINELLDIGLVPLNQGAVLSQKASNLRGSQPQLEMPWVFLTFGLWSHGVVEEVLPEHILLQGVALDMQLHVHLQVNWDAPMGASSGCYTVGASNGGFQWRLSMDSFNGGFQWRLSMKAFN